MKNNYRAEIDTPALLLRMDAVEGNIAKMAAFFADKPCKLRPHVKTHKLPLIARKQIEAGAVGLTCATLTEAEIFLAAGCGNILVANEIVGEAKLARMARLSRDCDLTVCVDDYENACDISRAAEKFGSMPGVLIEVNVGFNRCGVPPGGAALALGRQVAALQHVRFRGLMGYEGGFYDCGAGEMEHLCRRSNRLLVETRDLFEANGLPVELVSAGGTHTYRVTGTYPGITDIQAGAYATMDARGAARGMEFAPSIAVLATVISRSEKTRAIIDAGTKSLSVDAGMPVADEKGLFLYKLNEEHGYLKVEGPGANVAIGDKIEIIPWHGATTIPLFDRYHVIRGNRVESVVRFKQNH